MPFKLLGGFRLVCDAVIGARFLEAAELMRDRSQCHWGCDKGRQPMRGTGHLEDRRWRAGLKARFSAVLDPGHFVTPQSAYKAFSQ